MTKSDASQTSGNARGSVSSLRPANPSKTRKRERLDAEQAVGDRGQVDELVEQHDQNGVPSQGRHGEIVTRRRSAGRPITQAAAAVISAAAGNPSHGVTPNLTFRIPLA